MRTGKESELGEGDVEIEEERGGVDGNGDKEEGREDEGAKERLKRVYVAIGREHWSNQVKRA